MAINRVEIKDFLVFKGEFAADFCPGVNVLIGGNATGKTTLMKVLYAACEWGNQRENSASLSHIFSYFSFPYEEKNRSMDSGRWTFPSFSFKVSTKYDTLTISAWNIEEDYHYMEGNFLDIKSVFIPSIELFSRSEGLLSLNTKYTLGFDKTDMDLLVNAGMPTLRNPAASTRRLLECIAKIINYNITEDKEGLSLTKDGEHIYSLHFEASGFRKFIILWVLIANGLLESGSILFWDEPENSLNPELVPKLVDILLELSRNGVQIFIATHDYNLARYFDIRKDKNIPVMFHNLSKKDDGQINCDSSERYLNLSDNLLEKTGEELFNAVVADAMGVEDNE